MTEKKHGGYVLSSLDSALRILDILRVRGNLGVSEISRLSKVGKSSAFNILYTLERRGYVAKTESCKYFLGSKFFDTSFLEHKSKSLTEISAGELKQVALHTGETVWVAVLNINGRVVSITTEEGFDPECAPGRLGLESDATCIAPGKILLSYLDSVGYNNVMKEHLFKQYTSYTITDNTTLRAQLHRFREMGYATDFNERYLGFGDVSVPIFDQAHTCIAALSIVGRTNRLEQNLLRYVSLLQETAGNITMQLC